MNYLYPFFVYTARARILIANLRPRPPACFIYEIHQTLTLKTVALSIESPVVAMFLPAVLPIRSHLAIYTPLPRCPNDDTTRRQLSATNEAALRSRENSTHGRDAYILNFMPSDECR
jgi:hypothetical protein